MPCRSLRISTSSSPADDTSCPDGFGLTEAELENEPPARGQDSARLGRERSHDVEPVGPGGERHRRFILHHFWLKCCEICLRHIGRVGNDDVERSIDAGQHIRTNTGNPIFDAVASRR